MPASTISKLAGHFARLAAASAAAAGAAGAGAAHSGAQGLRGAASQAGAGGSGAGFAQGLSGAGSSGAGLGGAKYHAGRGAHSHFQNSGRAIVNANTTSVTDGSSTLDEEEELQRRSSTALNSRRGSIVSLTSSRPRKLATLPQPASTSRAGLQRRFVDAFDGVRSQMLITPALDDKGGVPPAPRRSALAPAVAAVRGQMLILPTIREDGASSPLMRTRSLSTSALASSEAKLETQASREAPPHMPKESVVAAPTAYEEIDVEPPPKKQRQATKAEETVEKMRQKLLVVLASGATHRGARQVVALLPVFKQAMWQPLTTEVYNLALESLVVCLGWTEPEQACNQARELYVRMIERDCLPDATTFSLVVRAFALAEVPLARHMSFEISRTLDSLSYRGEGSITKDALAQVPKPSSATSARLKQAMTLAQAAHNSAQPFPTPKAYQDLLYIAARHGDVAAAKRVIGMLSSSVTPFDAWSYALYIEALSRDTEVVESESAEEGSARKLKACQEALEEWRTGSASAKWDAKGAALVHDALLRAAFKLGDAAAAISSLEQRLAVTSKAAASAEQRMPPISSATLSYVFYGFIAANDVPTAQRWYEELRALHAKAGSEAQKEPFTIPPMVRSALAKELLMRLPVQQLQAMSPSEAAEKALPTLHSANLAYEEILPEIKGTRSFPWRLLAMLLERNGLMASSLAPSQPDVAQALLDTSLSLIRRAFEADGEELEQRASAAMQVGFEKDASGASLVLVRLTKSLDQVMQALCAQARVLDAASVMTYALAVLPPAQPRNTHLTEAHRATYDGLVNELQSQIRSTANVIVQGSAVGEAEALTADKLIASPATHLVATAEYLVGALRAAGLQPDTLAPRIVQLYHLVRAALQAEGAGIAALEGLSTRGWGNVQDAFMRVEEMKSVDFHALRSEGLGMLLADLATLPAEVQPTLHPRLPHVLAERYGHEGVEVVAASHPGLAHWLITAPWNATKEALTASPSASHASVAGYSASIMTQDAHGVASTIDTPPYTPMYQAKLSDADAIPVDEHLQLPPSYVEPAGAQTSSLPAVRIIDTDMGDQLRDELTRSRQAGRYVPAGVTEAEDVWGRINEGIAVGTYPSPEPLCDLLNTFGRGERLERVHEVYAMGQHIIASLSNDAAWQASAWAELEDAMICALAHGGDTDAASVHRHRLIAGGGVPSVAAYAALIATVRDTTDDALVAQELFDESQRMGVRPNTFLYNAVISKLARARKGELAVRLFEEMRGPALQLRPSSITYGAVINACARTGDEENAERLFAVMEEDPSFRPRVPPYNTMMQFFAQTKPNREKVLKYYNKLRRAGVAATEHTYKLLLDAYGLLEPVQLDEMKRVFSDIERDPKVNVQGVHWAAMITAVGAQDLQAASELFTSIASAPSSRRAARSSTPLPDVVCCEAMLAVYVNHGRIDLMQDHLAQMEARRIGLTAYIANLVIRGYATTGADGLEQARSIFEQMRDPPTGLAAQGNHPVGHRHHGAGAAAPAPPKSSKSKQAPALWQDVHREPSTWEAMVRAEVANQQPERAMSLIERMTERGYPAAVVLRARALIDEPAGAGAPAA